MIDVNAETARIEAEVKNVITKAGGNTDNVYFTVRACRERTGSSYRSGNPTGMFTIDLWSLRSNTNHHSRGRFRTTKAGVVPGDKISEYVTYQLAVRAETAARKAKLEAVQADNAEIAARLLATRARTGTYWSGNAYATSVPTPFVSANSGIVGKVKIGLPYQYLTEDQAKQLFALLDSFK